MYSVYTYTKTIKSYYSVVCTYIHMVAQWIDKIKKRNNNNINNNQSNNDDDEINTLDILSPAASYDISVP